MSYSDCVPSLVLLRKAGAVPEFTLGDRLRELAGCDKETFAKILGISRGSVPDPGDQRDDRSAAHFMAAA